jgi:hypothetical protein
MAIVKIIKRETPYMQIDKTGVNDNRLSWGATGLLTYLIGRPSDWKIKINHLSTVKEKDKKDKTRCYLNELREFEYCHYFEIRKKGKVVETFYLIFEVPTKYEEVLDDYVKVPEGCSILHKKISTKEKKNKKEKSKGNKGETPKLENTISASPISVNPTLLIKEDTKERLTNKRTTTTKERTERKNSSSYDFLDLSKYTLLNLATKKNIEKNIPNLTEEKFIKIYELTLSYINSGKGENFNAILYKGLNEEWNYDIKSSDGEKEKVVKKELDGDKKKWLSYFAGIISDKNLKLEIEKIIIDIPLEILNKNKSKLAKVSSFEFKQNLISLRKSI